LRRPQRCVHYSAAPEVPGSPARIVAARVRPLQIRASPTDGRHTPCPPLTSPTYLLRQSNHSAHTPLFRAPRAHDRHPLKPPPRQTPARPPVIRHFPATVCHLCPVSLGGVFFPITPPSPSLTPPIARLFVT